MASLCSPFVTSVKALFSHLEHPGIRLYYSFKKTSQDSLVLTGSDSYWIYPIAFYHLLQMVVVASLMIMSP